MKATMANYPGVKLTAIQDDIDIMGPPGLVFGAAREDGELQPCLLYTSDAADE